MEFGCDCAQVLITDDIDMNRFVIKEILRSKFGLSSDQAVNGKNAIEMIKQKAFSECCGFYKVIFMDYEMPIMNGLEVTLINNIFRQPKKLEI